MKVRVLYNPRRLDLDSGEYEKPFYVFIINGKGDWGNEEPWGDEEFEIFLSLKAALEEEFGYGSVIGEGYTAWLIQDEKWQTIADWKDDVMEVYRSWKNDFKRQERSGQ